VTDFTNLDLLRLPKIPDLKLSDKWNSTPSYVWASELIIDYYLGISNLEGEGWLFDNWLLIEQELINEGIVAVVYYGKRFLIANIINIEKNLLNEITNLQIQFLNDDETRDFTKKMDRLVIFRNNVLEKADLKGLSNYTQRLDMYLELIRHSLEMTKDVLKVKTKGKLGQKAEDHIIQGLAKGKLVNIYYEDKRTKQPVDPNSYSYELTGGEFKQRESYWKEYHGVKEEVYERYKIRHIDSADKFSRTNNPEIYSNLASYWTWEKQRGRQREIGIREFMEKFPKEGKYRLKYGFIFSSKQDEQDEEIKQDEKGIEKDLKKDEIIEK
jgi:hypothetical protein